MTPTTNSFNLVSYVVDGSTAVFVETDSSQLGLGSFGVQTSSAKSNCGGDAPCYFALEGDAGKEVAAAKNKIKVSNTQKTKGAAHYSTSGGRAFLTLHISFRKALIFPTLAGRDPNQTTIR